MSQRDEVEITSVQKRGEWYTVKGVASGKHVSLEIPAPSLDGKSRAEGEKLMKRGIHGHARESS